MSDYIKNNKSLLLPKKEVLCAPPILASLAASPVSAFRTTGGGAGSITVNGTEITDNTYIYPNSSVTISGGIMVTAESVATLVFGPNVSVRVHLWGASGGNGGYGGSYWAGPGGYVTAGVEAPASGMTLYLYLGEGGQGADAYTNGGNGGWPNGGYGTRGDASGAGGGGMTMLASSNAFAGRIAQSNPYTLNSIPLGNVWLIAGAGGGTTGYAGHAGGGGGQYGTTAGGGGGTGGSFFSGGTYNGGFLQGGHGTGAQTSGTDDGGGGGGGLYGGGGGTSDAKPGGGGSGYYNVGNVASNGYTNINLAASNGSPGAPNNGSVSGTPLSQGALTYLQSGFAYAKQDNGNSQRGNPGLCYIEFDGQY